MKLVRLHFLNKNELGLVIINEKIKVSTIGDAI